MAVHRRRWALPERLSLGFPLLCFLAEEGTAKPKSAGILSQSRGFQRAG